MVSMKSAFLPAISLHYKCTPFLLDKFPFLYDTKENKLERRKYTFAEALAYRLNLYFHLLYVMAEIYVTVRAPGGLADKATATAIVLCNCAALSLRWELNPDPVPMLVINKILSGSEGTILKFSKILKLNISFP